MKKGNSTSDAFWIDISARCFHTAIADYISLSQAWQQVTLAAH